MHYIQIIKIACTFIEKVFHKYADICARYTYIQGE